jgi:hypothetical protein
MSACGSHHVPALGTFSTVLTFEFAEPARNHCDCCGGVTTALTRYVYRDGDAHAVYYARFGNQHEPRIVEVVVSIGEWGDGTNHWDRVAFALRLRAVDSEYQVTVVDASESPWQGVQLLGRMLDRDEALGHERLQEVFHITDHMVLDDQPIRDYLK